MLRNEYEVAIGIIKEVGKVISRSFRFNRLIDTKSFANFVTDIDYKVEKLMVEQLRDLIPNSYVVTEETYNKFILDEEYVWILDPVDGTTNLIHRYPHVAISLSLVHKGQIVFGIIYNPLAKELFYAEKNGGAYRNQQKISVSQNKYLDECIVGFGLPYNRNKGCKMFEYVQRVFELSQDVKRKGPAALDIAYVACGRLDAYFEMDLHPWDFSAGKLILEESGGVITQWNGDKVLNTESNNILATNGYIHNDIKRILI